MSSAAAGSPAFDVRACSACSCAWSQENHINILNGSFHFDPLTWPASWFQGGLLIFGYTRPGSTVYAVELEFMAQAVGARD